MSGRRTGLGTWPGAAADRGRARPGGAAFACRTLPLRMPALTVALFLLTFLLTIVLPAAAPGFPATACAQRPTSGEETDAFETEAVPSTPNAPAFPFSEAAAGNALLEARLDSVRVEHGDGRPAESIAVYRETEGPYLAVGDLGRVGDGYRWNPETWRGSLRFDSTEVGFALDNAVFWVRGTPVQTPAPVRYRAGTVLLPLSFLDAVVAPLLGARCEWAPATGRLVIAGPPPWISTLALEGNEPTAALTIGPVTEDALRLRWDPQGILLVEARGVRLPVDRRTVSGRAEGVETAWVHCTARGTEVALRLDARWASVRLRSDRGGGVRVEWTTKAREAQVEGFQPLGTYAVPERSGGGSSAGRVVLLEVGAPPRDAGAGADCLQALAEKVAGVLSSEFGLTVIRVPDRGVPGAYRTPAGLPETPGVPPGDCWIGLRLEGHGSAGGGEFAVVVPGPPARREPLRVGALASAAPRRESPALGLGENPRLRGALLRVPPWGQVARSLAPSSARLARTVAEHLNYRWADRPVRISARPARIFRGVGVPALLLYPAATSDEAAMGVLCDDAQAADLARNLAYAVDEFLLSVAGGE